MQVLPARVPVLAGDVVVADPKIDHVVRPKKVSASQLWVGLLRGCGRLSRRRFDAPEVWAGFDPVAGNVAHVGIDGEQLVL